MSLTFTNQSLKSALVPMFVGSFGQKVPNADGTWTMPRANEGGDTRKHWWWIWALYTFRDADQEGRVSVIEGRMLLGQYIHDFCGGVLASSGGCIVRNAQDRYDWDSPRLGWNGASNLRISDFARANVPSLHDALRMERALTRAEAEAILNRSTMFWALARMNDYGKRGLVGFDRYSERCKFRKTLRHAAELSAIPNFTINPQLDAENAVRSTVVGPHSPPEIQENLIRGDVLDSARFGILRRITTQVHEAPAYMNRNSGSNVGAIMVSYSVPGDEDEDEYGSEWDDDLGEYVDRRPPHAGDVSMPEYWRVAARTPAYLAQQPIGLWNNG